MIILQVKQSTVRCCDLIIYVLKPERSLEESGCLLHEVKYVDAKRSLELKVD